MKKILQFISRVRLCLTREMRKSNDFRVSASELENHHSRIFLKTTFLLGLSGLLGGCNLNNTPSNYSHLSRHQKPLLVYATTLEQTADSFLTFDASLQRLQQKEYDRHPSPKEICNFIVDGIEGKLAGSSWQYVFEDMQQKQEWVSMAFQRNGPALVVYKDPEGFVWKGTDYVIKTHLWHTAQKTFSIKENTISLNQCSNDFLLFVYGRQYHQLPEQAKHAVILLPDNGKILPVRRFGLLSLDGTNTHAYSRGLQQKEVYCD